MFNSIKAKNFYSWKVLEFNFHNGVTLITGDNLDDNTSEGAGKSSIFEALTWCLYGQSSRDVNLDDVIHTGEKTCIVEVELNDGTIIVRSRKPNQLYIEYKGSVEQGKDIKETQKLIEKLIGISHSSFMNSVYFAQNYSNKFITATQENKAKILSELQDLSIFDKASKTSADKAKDIKNSVLVQLAMEKNYADNNLLQIKSEINTFEKLSQTFDKDRMSQLDEVIAASYTVSIKINDLENQIKDITNLSSIDSKMDESEEIQRQLIECKSQLYHIGMMKAQKEQAIANRNCPTCGQEVQKDSCEDIVIPDDTELKGKHDYLKEEHSRVMLECAHLINKKNENSLLKEKVQNLQEQKNQITREIERVERLDNPYLNKLEELSINKKKLYNKLEVINQSILLQNTLQTRYEYLKDGFKQIKSYVFQSLLSELNRSTNRYLNELFEVPASIIFDNISDDGEISKIKTTVMLDGNERSLGLLSGGQFRRVQLAVDFALSDIVAQRSKNPINVKILDEAFKDLSEPSMERIVGVLQKMSGCTILIEHNSIIKNIVNRVYKVELKEGISRHV